MPVKNNAFIVPDWNAPDAITAVCSTRQGGVSRAGFDSFNLATHVEDDPARVALNRQRLLQQLGLSAQPQWLEQTHSIRAIDLDRDSGRDGDAAVTRTPGRVAVVLTADCLPVLFTNSAGSEVAAAHAGWRGLLNGVLEQTLAAMHSKPEAIMAWLGPAIGPQQFEVGAEVREQFVQQMAAAEACFVQNRAGHYLADLYQLARLRLEKQGLSLISGGDYCTYTQSDLFYSYRREKVTGRQASLIYINK
ncbi:MAG: peptidoglycan editing factor PgeF [Gammaproteobacteria bacterium]|nr:peptidoglycan editing factor PgeF [Gammaproteobacteria bacterium]MBL6999213.1 peptidoglycan editing factor PgeF [Gammaproteobacteria bacterium]